MVRSAGGGYDLHTDYAASKAQRISAAMLRNINIPNHAIGWRLFQVYVQPCLQYGSNAWNPMHKGFSDVIESIQRRYTKRLRGFKSFSYQQRLQELGALSSMAYLVYSDMKFTFKVIKGLTPFTPADFGFTLSKHSRGPMFVLELIKRSRARQFARYRIPRQWNELPLEIHIAANLVRFKNLLYTWLSLNDPAF